MANLGRFPASYADLSEFFGVGKSCIANWLSSGMPKIAKGSYNLKDCFDWWLENVYKPKTASAVEEDSRERYWSAKADKEEMSRDQTKASLIARSDVVSQWAWRAAELRTSLLALSSRLPQRIDGLDIHACRSVIKAECSAILKSYCRDGRFTPAAEPKKPAKRKAPCKKRSPKKS